MARFAWPLLVAVAACLWLHFDVLAHPVWADDGFYMLHVAAMESGMSPADATSFAENFYLHHTQAAPQYQRFYEAPTGALLEFEHILGVRVGYTVPVAALLRARGPQALLDVTAAAYVTATLAMYALALAFMRRPLAAGAAVVFASLPLVRAAAAEPLADMPALFWWILALAVLVRYVQTATRRSIFIFALASAALVLTRPAIYLPLGAAAGAAVAVRGMRRAIGDLLTAASAVAGVFLIAQLLAHAASVGEHTAWNARRAAELGGPSLSVAQWYAAALRSDARFEILRTLTSPLVATATIGAAFGYARSPSRGTVVMAAGLVGSAAAIALNPVAWDLGRTFDLPNVPIVLVGASLAIAAAARRWGVAPR
ncbi:MAG: hypothetical protein ABR591_04020 [Candidatus Velthaea sp.]